MSQAEAIFAAMCQTEMRNWVGGGDPSAIGAANFTSVIENLPLRRSDLVLDFGCGIGRTSVFLAEFLNEGGQIVGTDIVPGQIQFCREQFVNVFQNATFHCLRSKNLHYDSLIASTAHATPAIDEEEFFSKYREVFDVVVAFSVFTHFDPPMAAHFLRNLRDVTKTGGHLFLTWLLDHPNNPAQFHGLPARLGAGESFSDPSGNLLFALYSPRAVANLAASANLPIVRISYGTWRGFPCSLKGQHPLDIVILEKPPPSLPADFNSDRYLQLNPDVANAGLDPAVHWREFGYREGRQWK